MRGALEFGHAATQVARLEAGGGLGIVVSLLGEGLGVGKRVLAARYVRRLMEVLLGRPGAGIEWAWRLINGEGVVVQHRHIEPQGYTLAAIDDVISRGRRQDWRDLRRTARRDPTLREKIIRVCQAHVHDPYAQRYYFWSEYARRRLS